MLAGSKTTETSDGVLGCTFQSRRYMITINGEKVNVWDTAGHDEGTLGRVSPEMAERNLTQLLRELRSAEGVHLLVYCIRGPIVRKSLARNYVIFYSAICRKKVPIVAVVTGLENEPNSMDDWWTKGEKELAKYNMRFDDHACVTTIDMKKHVGSVFEERSIRSQQLVQNLIIDNCHRLATRPPSDINAFIKTTLNDFRSMIRFGWENFQPFCNVIFYQADIFLFPSGVFGNPRKIDSQINGRSFVFQCAGDLDRSERHPTGDVDLLIFVGSMPSHTMDKFHDFYATHNGELYPLLVVTDNDSVDEWKKYLDAVGICARVASIPSSNTAQANLRDLIDGQCLIRGPARDHKTNYFRFWM